MIEVEDILHELHTLEIVLMDQKVTLEKMNETVSIFWLTKDSLPDNIIRRLWIGGFSVDVWFV